MKHSKRVKKTTTIKNVLAYARVSTTEQAEKDLSIPAQFASIRRYCQDRGYTIIEEFTEPGASGRDDHRKAFKRMVETALIPDRKIDAIVVYQTSRFFRNAVQAGAYKDTLKKHGVTVLSVTQELSDDPMGHLIEGIFQSIDQYESEINGMRTTAAMRENARRGYLNGSATPFGFRADTVVVGQAKKRKLAVDPQESELVREIMRMYVSGSGAKSIAVQLNERGIRYRKGSPWTRNRVLDAIENEALVGEYYWGKTDATTGQYVDREDWILIPCEPIIERDLFDLVADIRSKRDPVKVPGRTTSSPLLLAGLLSCGKCGSSYSLETSGKTLNDGAAPFRYYNCSKFLRSGRDQCSGHRLPTEKVERTILNHIADRVFTIDQCRDLLKDIVEESGLLRKRASDQRREWERQLAQVKKAILNWNQAFESGDQSLQELGTDRLRELKEQQSKLEETMAKVVPIGSPPPHLYRSETIQGFLDSLKEVFLSGTHELTRTYLRLLVKRIVVNDDVAEIELRTDGAAALMAQGNYSSKPTELTCPEAVLTSVTGWLQLQDSNLGPGG